ncbi:hypothetical protein [Halomonas sp. E19]
MTLRHHRAGLGLCAALVLAGCGDDQQAAAPEEGRRCRMPWPT